MLVYFGVAPMAIIVDPGPAKTGTLGSIGKTVSVKDLFMKFDLLGTGAIWRNSRRRFSWDTHNLGHSTQYNTSYNESLS